MIRDDEALQQTISRYLDDEADERETAWLAARLGAVPEVLDEFVERLLLESELIHLGSGNGLAGVRRGGWWKSISRQRTVAMAAAAAVAVMVAGIFAMRRPQALAVWRASPGSVVSVSGPDGPAGRLMEGATMQVAQGCAEVEFAEGVRCVVQAPAMLMVVKKGLARLEDGAARFRVEPRARGFEVRCKALSVVDFGTEFGIDAGGESRAEVHVLKGLVDVRPSGGFREATRVAAGSAVALAAAGRLEAVPSDGARFPADLPKGLPALRFSFDRADGGTLRGEGAIARRYGARLQFQGAHLPVPVPGKFGSALAFGGGAYASSNWKGVAGTQPRTVSFWVRIEPRGRLLPYPLLGWGVFRERSKMSDFGIRTTEDSGHLRIVSGKRWLEGGRNVMDGAWHHVAVVLGSYQRGSWPETKLYVDGAEDSLMPGEPADSDFAPLDSFWTEVDHVWSQPLTIGRFGLDDEPYLPGLSGEIDEVIVAEGVLTREQVTALYEGRLHDSGLDLDGD